MRDRESVRRRTTAVDTARRLCLAVWSCIALAACGEKVREPADVAKLATDVHIDIAEHKVVLPRVAVAAFGYVRRAMPPERDTGGMTASIVPRERWLAAADPERPLAMDGISIRIDTYGWDDGDLHRKRICPLLTRAWARSACDNPWAAVQQALPPNRFQLVDLRHLRLGDARGPAACVDHGEPHRPVPEQTGVAVLACEARVVSKEKFHHAIVRIDGDLGALWTVWGHGQFGETAEAMADREGKAIAGFVRYGLGKEEDFGTLQGLLCGLRAPGSVEGVKGSDCG